MYQFIITVANTEWDCALLWKGQKTPLLVYEPVNNGKNFNKIRS